MIKILIAIFIFYLSFLTELYATTTTSSSTIIDERQFTQQISANGVVVSIYNLNGFFFANDVPIGTTLSTSTVNGVYYINGMPITNYVNYYNNSLGNNSYSLNKPIWSDQSICNIQTIGGQIVNSPQCFQNSSTMAINFNDGAALYLQAFTEFSLKDYRNALRDCNSALSINPRHAQAIVLRTVIQALQSRKITEEEAQDYIARTAQKAGNL